MEVVMEPVQQRGNRYSASDVTTCELFCDWAARNDAARIPVTRVRVYAAFGWPNNDGVDEIRMLHMGVDVDGVGFEQATFLRGPTVDMLTILECEGNTYLVHVDQLRVAVGQIVRSNPAGMVDGGEVAAAAALRELAEELQVHIDWGEPLNLNQAAYGADLAELGTPGGSDEDVTFFAVRAFVTPDVLKILQGRLGGLEHEGERIIVRLTKFEGELASALPKLVVDGRRPDMKAAHSILLYDHAMRLKKKRG